MFGWTSNAPLIKNAVNVGCGWAASVWNLFGLYVFSRIVNMVLVLWGFKDKIMLPCLMEVKCQQSYTPGISY